MTSVTPNPFVPSDLHPLGAPSDAGSPAVEPETAPERAPSPEAAAPVDASGVPVSAAVLEDAIAKIALAQKAVLDVVTMVSSGTVDVAQMIAAVGGVAAGLTAPLREARVGLNLARAAMDPEIGRDGSRLVGGDLLGGFAGVLHAGEKKAVDLGWTA